MRPSRTFGIFHTVENYFSIFPHCGKKFSTLWKNQLTHRTPRVEIGSFYCGLSTISVRCAQHVAVRKRILENAGFARQNKRANFLKMARCGRPEQYLCTRVGDLDAPGQKRRAFVLPPHFLKSFSARLPAPPSSPPTTTHTPHTTHSLTP